MELNYDKIILELLSRVKDLEDEMAQVKARLTSDVEAEEGLEEGGGITRSLARERAIQELQKRFPDYLVRKASRKDGSGILLQLPSHKTPCKIKFSHSRVYETGHSWHTIRLTEIIDEVSYCMFSVVDASDTWHFFIYGTDELKAYNKAHRTVSDADILHLYFSVQGGRAIEKREDIVDVTDHLDNWQVLDRQHIKF